MRREHVGRSVTELVDASNLSGSGVNPKDTTIPAGASDECAKKLSNKERLFVEGYLQTLNKRQAAEYAGYTKAPANRRPFDVFNRPHVREAIELLLQTRAGVTKAWIIDQLVEIAQTKATDIYEWNEIGLCLKNSDEIEKDKIGAVAEVEETRVVDERQRRYRDQNQDAQPASGAKGLGENLPYGG
jgi:Terminase small subunit